MAIDISKNQMYERLFESSDDMLCVAESAGRFLLVNKAFRETLGYTTEELCVHPFMHFVHPDDVQETIDTVAKIVETGGSVINFENRYRCKDGSYKWLNWTATPVAEEGLTYATARDVTKLRQQTEKALLDSKKSLAEAQRIANMGNWTFDAKTGELQWSEQVYRIFGQPREYKPGYEAFYDLVHPDDREAIRQLETESMETHEPYAIDHRIIRPDGTIHWLHEEVIPDFDDDGQLVSIHGTAQDITGRKQAEQKIVQLNRSLDEAQKIAHIGNWWLNIVTGELHWSDEIYRIFGWEPREFEPNYERFFEAVHPEDVDAFKASEEAAFAKRELHSIDHRIILPDGIIRWVHEETVPSYNDEGEMIYLSGTVQDITERKNVEDSLRFSQQHLKLYREQAPMATIEWNTDFQVLDWNTAAQEMFGYTVDEVKGRNFVDVILPDSAVVNVKQIWKNLMAQTGGEISINENITKDGRIILCEWHNTAIKDETGNVIGAASIVQDITERQQRDEQLKRSQKMEALGKLTGGIAHDYNNMLGVILGYSELIKEMSEDSPKLNKFADHIHHAAERGTNLTKKLLTFSRHKISNPEKQDINALLTYEKDMLQKTLTARINLVYELEDDVWPVWIDGSELEDAILNMSINAMHAIYGNGQLTIHTYNKPISKKESEALQISMGDYVVLSLTDTGSGMDDDTKARMFDPFYSTKGNEGTGLGLSQVYGFVQSSNGTISVHSEPGHGTQLNLFFPRYYDFDRKEKTEKIVQKEDLQGTGNILVVDDEPSLALLCSEVLGEHGYTVYCANSGKEALEVLEKKSIDLLLSDIIMPNMDGFQLAKIAREKYPNIKIQLASGFTDKNTIKTDSILNESLLYKPYDLKTLLLRMHELLT